VGGDIHKAFDMYILYCFYTFAQMKTLEMGLAA
jgi:hypothetical protein